MRTHSEACAPFGRPLHLLGAKESAEAIKLGQITASELVDACFRQIDTIDSKVHAWVHIDRNTASETAFQVDRKIADGSKLGAFAGVPIGIKDIFNTLGMPCQMGSPLWANFRPGNDARVVHYLRRSDAIFPGKTVTAEFAVHAPGSTENPHRHNHTPGTSSSGSAAAVAAYMVPVALGTQTAGSIIRPASYCGIYGMKPSFGVVPRTGMLKTTDTLDTVGWFARNVDDLKLMFDTIRVRGEDFPLMEAAFADPTRQLPSRQGRWKVALCHGPKWDESPSSTRGAVEGFAARIAKLPGVEVTNVKTPAIFAQAHSVHSHIYDRTLAYYFKDEFKQHSLVSSVMYDIIAAGNKLSADDYPKALQRQNEIAMAADAFLQQYDVALDLATATEAMEGLDSVDAPDHSLIWTLCRVPAVSAPALMGPTGLPLGIQFVARRYADPKLLSFLHFLAAHDVLPKHTNPALAMA